MLVMADPTEFENYLAVFQETPKILLVLGDNALEGERLMAYHAANCTWCRILHDTST